MNAEVSEVEAEVAEVEVDNVKPAFVEAIAAEKSEDDVKMAMIGAGATFKNVTRLFNQYMVDEGYAISKKEKDEIVTKILDGKDLTDEKVFGKAVEAIQGKAAGVTEKSAAALIRSYAKANELECFKKAASEGGPRVSFRSRFFDALKASPKMTKEECHAYLENDVETSKNVMNHESVYQGIRELCNDIANGKK